MPMTLDSFSRAVNDLCEFYERKAEPKIQTLELWHAKVKHVPGEALPWIIRRITEEYESFPRNVPMAMRSAADEWWQAHPEKAAQDRFVDCPDCQEGLIYLRHYSDKHKTQYSYVFRCARCQQNTVQEYPAALLVNLLAQGYEIPVALAKPKHVRTWKPKVIEASAEHIERVRKQAMEVRHGDVPF